MCFLALRPLPGPPGLLGSSGAWISENPGLLSEPLVLESFRCVSLLSGFSRALRAYWGVLGLGFPRIPDPSLNHWFWSHFAVFPCSPGSPGPPGFIVVFWGPMLCSKTVCSTNPMFKNRMFYKPYAMLCYVQKPFSTNPMLCSKTVCSTNPMLYSKTVCSTNPMFHKSCVQQKQFLRKHLVPSPGQTAVGGTPTHTSGFGC